MRIVFFLLCLVSLAAEPLKVSVGAKSAILMNAETGAVLFEKSADERAYPASLTKIATALYAVKKNKKALDAKVTCSQQCLRRMNKSVKVAHGYKDPAYFLEPDGTHFWLKKGEEMPFIDLLYGILIPSGNDASNTVANYIGGSIPKFVDGMNQYLKKIGCTNTQFMNPHGLHHPNHWTTARDLAIITREALKEELIRTIVSTQEYERCQTNLQTPRKILNKNKLIVPGKFFYSRAIGMKIGYHSDAKHTYASVARDGNRTLIAVLLGYDDPHQQFRDAIRLFEAAFEEEKEERLLFRKEENTFSRELKGAKGPLKATLTEDIAISYFPSEEPDITIELNWEHLTPPISQGRCVGAIKVFDGEMRELESSPLIATAGVERSLPALVGAAVRGEWTCPSEFQKILTLFLGIGVMLTLFGLYRFQGKEKG
ncbi:MAG: D-alanyl-D-alanine carboxypeptidase [Chlamydiia bacterium]|nr:D-alanyl-D-alanine carboxypeptidase [Chlamydiia bacterium]